MVVLITLPSSFAANVPQAVSLGGELFLPDGTAVVSSRVNFRIQVLDAAQSCVLYSENQLAVDLSRTNGRFNLILGTGSGVVNNVGTPGVMDVKVFANPGVVSVANCASPTVALNAGDQRMIRISYDVGGGYVALTPDVPMVASAYAMVADSLQGKSATDFIQVLDNGTTALNQANTEYAFSNINWPRLKALLDGNSSQYLATAPTAPLDLNGQRITDLRDPAAAQDAVTKNYADTMVGGRAVDLTSIGPMTGNNNTLLWDATANKWVAGAVNTSPTGAAGGDLTGTYPNPTIANNTISSAKINTTNVGPNRLLITNTTDGGSVEYGTCAINEVYAWTTLGWACSTVTSLSPVKSVAGRGGDVVLTTGDIGGLGTAALYNYGTAANQIVRLDGSARIPAVDGSLLTNVNAVQLQTRDVANIVPTTGQILGWNGTAWVPVTGSAGSVTNVGTGVGLVGGAITTTGTLSVDVGTTALKILQLNASAQIPAVDGSLLYNVTVGGRPVATTAPVGGTVLGWNLSTSQWEPVAAATGSVQSVGTGNGLLGGTITTNGTLSVDTGTAANKILQLSASAQIPAVDGSQLFNVNASKIATRTVATTAPAANQVLGWNATTTQWEPITASTGSVQSVNSGTGLTGGPITTNGTLNVDVGTAANKILQLNGAAQVPAVDASLLFNVNASKIASRTVASTAPNANQVLGWNATTTQWEPQAGNANSVTTIATGNGMLGGPITSSGTISIDAGTAANRILQLNGSAQIPAVDASLLLQVNASKIATRSVSTAAPGTGQVLGWNTATTQWEPTTASNGSVQSVSSGVGLTGGPITTNGTLNVDVGTVAYKILQLNGSAQVPAVDGSQLYNVNASKIATRTVASTAPTSNQVLGWNASTTQWEPQAGNANSVTNIATGNGVLGGPITSTGTISIDAGTAANKILQLNGSAQIPAVDASLLLQVNASKLTTRTVSAAAPGPGQMLGWNTTTTQWEPTAASTGSVQSVNSGVGLTGGPITTNGTLNVDVGTTVNKILQLNGSAQIPAVDGSLLFNVNASKIATRTVAATAPAANQVLGWNASTSQWEPQAGNANSVTNIATGNGVLGGPITSTGTITIDAGTTANKILQLNSSAQIPSVDASLLYNVNASKIATRPISAAAPSTGQVLGWNATTTQWEPTSPPVGTLTRIETAVGLVGGPITSSGTLGVDVGTTANKIMQLNGSAQAAISGGTALAPAYSFGGSPSSGLYSSGAGGLGLSTSGTAALTISPGGAVGIGTSSPTGALDIWSNQSESFHVRDNSNAANPFYFYVAANRSGGGYVDIGGYQGGVGPVPLVLNRGGGNVGIGSSAPDFRLVVSGGTNAARFTTTDFVQGSTGSNLGVYTGANTGNTYGAIQSASGGGGTPDVFAINPSGGYVGINTTSPANGLELYGDGGRVVSRFATTSSFSMVEAQSPDYWTTPSYTGVSLKQFGSAASGSTAGLPNANLGLLTFQNGSAGLIFNNAGPIHFATSSAPSPQLTVAIGGNVGVGTTAPGAGTQLSVEGQIRTKSASITTGSVDWSMGNAISTTFDCGSAINFANLRDGASYTLVVTGAGTSLCTFNASTTGDDAGTLTYRFNPTNATRTASSHTIYSLMRIGTIVYVSWIPGF